jgi:hypothetical protein
LKPHEAVACGRERLTLVPVGVLAAGSSVLSSSSMMPITAKSAVHRTKSATTSLSRGKVSPRFSPERFRFSALKRILYMGAIHLQSIKGVTGEWEMRTRSRQRLAMR